MLGDEIREWIVIIAVVLQGEEKLGHDWVRLGGVEADCNKGGGVSNKEIDQEIEEEGGCESLYEWVFENVFHGLWTWIIFFAKASEGFSYGG